MKRIHIVQDLGPGDGGKGGIVHSLALASGAHTIVKVGGAQGSHGVRTKSGLSFNFSQLGCGTLEGIRTHVSRNFFFDPSALLKEVDSIRFECGFGHALDLLTVDEAAPCVTVFHQAVSRLRELHRKGNPKGTVGTGIGEACADMERHPGLVIRAGNLGDAGLPDLLEAIRLQKLADVSTIIADIGHFWEGDREDVDECIEVLGNAAASRWCADSFREVARRVRVVPGDYLAGEVLAPDGRVVIEASHGVLTDRYYGFHPHTSRLRTLPSRTRDMLLDAGYDGEIVTTGLFRAYGIRHGAGPFVTEDPSMLDRLLPGSSKDENRYQGRSRVGALDLVALRYAIDVCGGPQAFDGLAVTWFDQIMANGSWPICESYRGADDPEFFASDRQILVRRGEDETQLERQRVLGERLRACRPNVSTVTLPEFPDSEKAARFCADRVGQALGVPVRMVSVGPTEDHKEFL
jgi:adenylosuccinate synthase